MTLSNRGSARLHLPAAFGATSAFYVIVELITICTLRMLLHRLNLQCSRALLLLTALTIALAGQPALLLLLTVLF